MADDVTSREARTALVLLRASGRVIVDAGVPHADLVMLAQTAAQWGSALTIRNARLYSNEQLAIIAAAGRGHVTFDLTS
jgi:hypothetical protein